MVLPFFLSLSFFSRSPSRPPSTRAHHDGRVESVKRRRDELKRGERGRVRGELSPRETKKKGRVISILSFHSTSVSFVRPLPSKLVSARAPVSRAFLHSLSRINLSSLRLISRSFSFDTVCVASPQERRRATTETNSLRLSPFSSSPPHYNYYSFLLLLPLIAASSATVSAWCDSSFIS
jgi:hypothetical protein